MSKFSIGDEIILSVDPWTHCGEESVPFYIDDDTWYSIQGIPCIVTDNKGQRYYNGYDSVNAINIKVGGDDFGGCVFPEEFFEIYKREMFGNSEDFLI